MIEGNMAKKLELRWEGPYIIHHQKGLLIYLNIDGKASDRPIHHNRVKRYTSRTTEWHTKPDPKAKQELARQGRPRKKTEIM
jgi:hypothetical protein